MDKNAVCCVRPPLLQKPPSSPRSSKSASNSSAESAASHTASRMDKEKGCSCSQPHRDLESCRVLFLLADGGITYEKKLGVAALTPPESYALVCYYILVHASIFLYASYMLVYSNILALLYYYIRV